MVFTVAVVVATCVAGGEGGGHVWDWGDDGGVRTRARHHVFGLVVETLQSVDIQWKCIFENKI